MFPLLLLTCMQNSIYYSTFFTHFTLHSADQRVFSSRAEDAAHKLVFSRQDNDLSVSSFTFVRGTIQDGFGLHYLALFNGKVPSSDKQCSVRDAMDVLTPARTHGKQGRVREREVCEMGSACQRHKGRTNIAGRCTARGAHYGASLAGAVSHRHSSVQP